MPVIVAAIHLPWALTEAAAKLNSWGVPVLVIEFFLLAVIAGIIVGVLWQASAHNRQMRRGR